MTKGWRRIRAGRSAHGLRIRTFISGQPSTAPVLSTHFESESTLYSVHESYHTCCNVRFGSLCWQAYAVKRQIRPPTCAIMKTVYDIIYTDVGFYAIRTCTTARAAMRYLDDRGYDVAKGQLRIVRRILDEHGYEAKDITRVDLMVLALGEADEATEQEQS